MTLHTR